MDIQKYLPADLFHGRTVFITGGGSGINLGIARSFAAVGARLSICGRTQSKLDSARTELEALGAKVFTAALDVRDYDALVDAIERTKRELGPISVLVCGAAGNFLCRAEELTPGGFGAVVGIDLIGSFHTCRAAYEQLRETKGSIVFVSAGQSLIPYMAQAHVGAAKAGVDNLMRNLAFEWGPMGIRSNSIVPGPIAGTEGMRRLAPGNVGEKLRRVIPLQRFGEVEEIGNAAVFLASPLAAYITGTTLVVDGGQNLPGAGLFGQIIMEALT
jgi:NAD(P)-dependent dehydrogenase (short-subunit alcohol dehydrogenase family)